MQNPGLDTQTPAAKPSDWGVPLSLCAIGLLGSLWLYIGSGAGAPGKTIAVIYPPWWTAESVFSATAQADADIRSFGPFDWIMIAVPRVSGTLDDLYGAGALVVLNARFAALCGASPPDTSTG